MKCAEPHPDGESTCFLRGKDHGEHWDKQGRCWPNQEYLDKVSAESALHRGTTKRGAKKALIEIAAEGSRGRLEALAQERRGTTVLEGHRHGETYQAPFDYDRLNAQMKRVYDLLSDGQWWTLATLSARTGDPEASVSARIRDLRKPEFGGLEIERQRVEATGLYRYRLLGEQRR